MFRALDRFGLPVKYALMGVIGGVIWLIIAKLINYQSALGVFGTLASLAVGGFIGGYIRQRMGKSK